MALRIQNGQVKGLIHGRAIINVDRRARLDEYLDSTQIQRSNSMDQGSVVVFVQGVQVDSQIHKLSQMRVPNAMVRNTLEKLGVHFMKLESYD